MRLPKSPLRKWHIAFLILIAPLGLAYAGLSAVRNNSCLTETESEIKNLSGNDFEIVYTNCDTLAKDEAISVYVSKTSSRSWLPSWASGKQLLFRYDPGRYDAPLPTISYSEQKGILISVPSISSIKTKNRSWREVAISYEIGHVDYPEQD